MTSRLNPYLMFDGEARDAITFYQSIFSGQLHTNTYAEGGMSDSEATANLIMHAQLEAPNGFFLMASDRPPGMPHASGSNGVLSISGTDDAELRSYWNKLADGGTIDVPLEKAPWGDSFGQLTDRFGTVWMVNISGAPQ